MSAAPCLVAAQLKWDSKKVLGKVTSQLPSHQFPLTQGVRVAPFGRLRFANAITSEACTVWGKPSLHPTGMIQRDRREYWVL